MYANISTSISGSIESLVRMVSSTEGKNQKVTPITQEGAVQKFESVAVDPKLFAKQPDPRSPVAITWENVIVSTKIKNSSEELILINNISGSITGGIWAIMGPSGSGKVFYYIHC